MNARENLYAQNWVEQFRNNIGLCPCLSTPFDNIDDVFAHYGDVCDYIQYAFLWEDTPQHHGGLDGPWPRRQMLFERYRNAVSLLTP